MTLLLTVFAAVISTVVWYKTYPDNKLQLSTLSLMFWGASLMWFIDAVVEYSEMGAEFFTPSGADMLNDTYLGLSVIAFAMVIWIAVILIKDPKGVVKSMLLKK